MWWMMLAVLLVGCVQEASPVRSQLPGETAAPAKGAVTPIAQPPRRLTEGEVLYLRHCADCHGWEGRGNGPVGQVLLIKPPSLRRADLYSKNTEAELVARILLGKDLEVPLAPSAAQDIETETTALIAYIRRLPTIPWEEVNAGEDVYDSLCLSCHGIYGRGDGLMAPSLPPRPRDLTSPAYQSQVTNEELFNLIRDGKGAMPGVADVLSETEVRAVIAFIRQLSAGYELYDRFCAVCHGTDGHPPAIAIQELLGDGKNRDVPPVFNQAYMQTHSDEQLRVWVRHMLKQNRAVMPHFAGDLDAESVRKIIAYLRSLPPES